MRYLSLCSGIEAASVAWRCIDWKPAGFAEIEAFPSAVLKHRFPGVRNYGDMTKFKEWEDVGTVDVMVGGTPCQSFSVAGLRKGLNDPRGNLMLTFGAIANHFRPRWIIWENVPGVLSSNKGRDFGAFLGMLAECGYGFAYRVLDAQYFGVAQRRRRVFVVGHLGDWRRAAAVLFESESLSGNPPPSRSKGKEAAGNAGNGSADAVCLMDQGGSVMGVEKDLFGTLRAQTHGNEPIVCIPLDMRNAIRRPGCTSSGCGIGSDGEPAATITSCKVHAVCYENHGQDSRIKECSEVSPTLSAKAGTGGGNLPIVLAFNAQGSASQGASVGEVSPTLDRSKTPAVCFQQNTRDEVRLIAGDGGIAGALSASTGMKQQNYLCEGAVLRRLKPIECERLQGFPDDWTRIPYRRKPAEQCKDNPRYKACGNSMAVPVMRWIGERIEKVEKGLAE